MSALPKKANLSTFRRSTQLVDAFAGVVHDADQAVAPGKLLGNLLCSVAGLLENGGPVQGI